ncbi:MAG: nucleotide exchange factor GrpE [Chloroflexi bacterium]|nr:nucleotide exchange factor GrpE [Chloroflexota bacterium]
MPTNREEQGSSSSEEAQGPPPGLQPGAGPSEVEQLRAEMEEALRERNQFKDALQRALADFANYRRRMEEEREDLRKSATADFILKMLPILDDLERALAAPPQGESSIGSQWWEGVQLIARKLQALMEEAGVQTVEAEGRPFDPWEQEVVAYQESTDRAEGQVISIARKGYKLHGRVLRPALVVVAREPVRKENEEREDQPGKEA